MTGAMGDNINKDDLARFYLGKVAKAEEAKNSATGTLGSLYQKVEMVGLNRNGIKLARKIMKAQDPGVLIEELKSAIHYCQLVGVEAAQQLDLFAAEKTEPDRTPVEDRAFLVGYNDGMAGDPRENPHGKDTVAYARYEAGYNEGSEARNAFEDKDELIKVPEKKRGRPKKDAEDDFDEALDDDEDE